MKRAISESFQIQVQHLLRRSHQPNVEIRPSLIPGAGQGVFYVGNSGDWEDENGDANNNHCDRETHEKVLCLYPGIYTPPLPISAGILTSQEDNNEIIDTYLAGQMPPSGIDIEDDAYILNLESIGGYLDASALTHRSHLLDQSPSTCAHFINHYRGSSKNRTLSDDKPNVYVVSFWWKDILDISEIDVDSWYNVPNIYRCDGSPYYFDTINQKIVYFPDEKNNYQPAKYHHLVAGAAIVTRRSNDNISLQHGQELFLDYKLGKPLPKWAADWYRE